MKSVTSLGLKISCQRAFTLIEIMITVAIVAILAAIAFPSYSSFIAKSEIRSVQADLLALSLNLENQYQRTLAYPTIPDDKKTTTAGIASVLKGWSSSATNFNVKFEDITASTYKITAEGKSGSRQANCKISLSQDNTRTATDCKYVVGGEWL